METEITWTYSHGDRHKVGNAIAKTLGTLEGILLVKEYNGLSSWQTEKFSELARELQTALDIVQRNGK